MTTSWDEIRKRQGWKMRLRVRYLGFKYKFLARIGRCTHSATTGPVGGDQGVCLYCNALVDWNDE